LAPFATPGVQVTPHEQGGSTLILDPPIDFDLGKKHTLNDRGRTSALEQRGSQQSSAVLKSLKLPPSQWRRRTGSALHAEMVQA